MAKVTESERMSHGGNDVCAASPSREEFDRLVASPEGRKQLATSPEGREQAKLRGLCLDCGERWPRLYTHVQKHGPLAEYLERHGYSPETKLMSSEFRSGLQRQGKEIWGKIPPETQRKIRGLLTQTRGRPRPELFTQMGPGETWEAVRLRAGGATYQEIGKKLSKGWSTIHHRCQTLGASEGRGQLDFGQPFTWGDIRHLHAASGLTKAEFASSAGCRLGRPPRSQHVHRAVAAKIIDWRDQQVSALLTLPLVERRREGYRSDAVLETFYPHLRRAYKILLTVLPEMRSFLVAHAPTATVEGLAEFVADKARLETVEDKATQRQFFCDLLWWLPALSPCIENNFEKIRSSQMMRPLALTILGDLLRATADAVGYVVREKSSVIPPEKVRSLLLRLAGSRDKGNPAKAAGRPRGIRPNTEEMIVRAACCNIMNIPLRKRKPYLYPSDESNFDDTIYPKIKIFHSRHRTEIEARQTRLNPTDAGAILAQFLQNSSQRG